MRGLMRFETHLTVLMWILLLLVGLNTAAFGEEQRQLDPAKAADAVQIVHLLTEKLTLPRDQGVALTRAIETLAKLVQEHSAPPAPATTTDPKAKP